MLSDTLGTTTLVPPLTGLNAPFGARCFLTRVGDTQPTVNTRRLNAPFGARCFLTTSNEQVKPLLVDVLMHLLALGAF